jgi:hypothetical protein
LPARPVDRSGERGEIACVAYELVLVREVPDTSLAPLFDGEPLVQSFAVGGLGRAWITTAEALAVPGFGRPWVAARLSELAEQMGTRALHRALASGLRLHAEVALPLAA